MSNSLPPIESWVFNCTFQNFNIILNYETEFVEGPIFYLERTDTFWCLQLNASLLCNGMCKIQARLSRKDIPIGPPEINVQFSLNFETLHGQRIADEEIHSFSFSPGSHYDSTAVNILEPVTSILKTDDALLVKCEMYLVIYECRNSVEPCIEQLSNDFKLLFNERDTSGNAVLIVGEQEMRISVHKELLWARSSVLREYFRAELYEFQIPGYSPEVVKSMLEFMYSGDFTPLKAQNVFELRRCANEYGVSHLLNILQANEMFGIVKFQLDSGKYRWNCMNFTPQQHMLTFNDTGFKMLELKLSKYNIVFRVTANFDYINMFSHLFHVKMWNLNKINSVMMEMSVFDNNDNVSIISTGLMKPSFDGILDFSLSLSDEFLFVNEENLQEAPILHAKFKFKFQFKDLIIMQIKFAYTEARYMNKLYLSEEMDNFFETCFNTDVKIFPSKIENLDQPSENENSRPEICVHSSILGIRSNLLKNSLGSVKEIELPLSRIQVKNLMRYVYTGRVGDTSFRSLLDLYDANQHVCIPHFTSKCVQLIVKCILKSRNVLDI